MRLVSAIITTYKREPHILKRALESVINQTYKEIEIIVVDDSPSDYLRRDEIEKMVNCYENVKYIKHETPQGACVARNTGMNQSHGEYIAFLDDDDEWYPQKIEQQLNAFVNDKIALVYCGNDVIDDDTGVFKHDKRKFVSGMIFDSLIEDNFIGSTSYPLLRKDRLVEIGGFDALMQSSQDYDVWLRIEKKFEVTYIEESLVLYHIHSGDQITKNPRKKIAGLERIYSKYKEYIESNPNAKWNRTIKIAPFYAMEGDIKKALKLWIVAVIICPFRVKDNLRYLAEIFK